MSNYVIFTDSGCDISPELLEKWGVKVISLTLMFDGSEEIYTSYDISAADFYEQMRQGKSAHTSAVNSQSFKEIFEQELQAGNDVFYIGFSSGLSTTVNSARMAADELKEEYPDRKVVVVDTLCASAGQGLVVYLAVEKKNNGADIDELQNYIREICPKMCHWFTVDDLEYLKRGGRVSPAVALIGSVLGIKPVLHVDDEGHLIKVTQVRGRKNALKAIADKYAELALDKENGKIFISQADCMDDAKVLADMVKDACGAQVELIEDIGPVIGAHAGPGTIALFFLGSKR